MQSHRTRLTAAAALLAAALAPCCAWAHPGHAGAGGSFVSGVLHPISGADHLLAALAVGLYAASAGRRAGWLLVATFLACLAGGAAVGRRGVAVPWLEQAIAASVLILGLMIATRVKLPLATAAGLVGLFAAFHGYAHGSEMAAGLAAVSYASGFLATTAALLIAGVACGRGLARRRGEMPARLVGTSVAIAGLLLLAV